MELSKLNSLREMVSIREEIDRLFDSFFGKTPRLMKTEESEWSPVMDVEETSDEFVVIAEIPGVRKQNVKISVSDDRLSISGNREKRQLKDTTCHRLERSFGRFKRTITLPSEIKADTVKASYQDGLLTVTLPKVHRLKPKEISVEVK